MMNYPLVGYCPSLIQKEQWMPTVLIFHITRGMDGVLCDNEGRCCMIVTAFGAVEMVISLAVVNECQSAF